MGKIYVKPVKTAISSGLDFLPVTLTEVKTSARMDVTETLLDPTITSYIKAITSAVERYAGITIRQTDWIGYYDSFPTVMRLKKRPNFELIGNKVEYYCEDIWNVLDEEDYEIQECKYYANIFSKTCFPDVEEMTSPAVRINHRSGYANATVIPQEIKEAIIQGVVFLLQSPESCGNSCALPLTSKLMLKDYKDKYSYMED